MPGISIKPRQLSAAQPGLLKNMQKPGTENADILHALLAIDRAVLVGSRGLQMGPALELLCQAVEGQAAGLFCSILILDREKARLFHGAAPSLPESYARAIDGVAIGPNVGSCGTAAYRGQRVIVTDIPNDPLWVDF